MSARPFTFYEFFAGGGMARAGLGEGWECLFANDFDKVKAQTYRANWGGDHFHEGDVHALTTADLPQPAGGRSVDLAWASSPCQDLSLAGKREGLSGARSSAFWGFWSLMKALNEQGRAPRTIVIENVTGLLTSHGGADFTALCQALADEGYRFGALEIDAARFLPQSRPRMFLVATRSGSGAAAPPLPEHGAKVAAAYARLPHALQRLWICYAAPGAPKTNVDLAAVLEPANVVRWHTHERTTRMLTLLSPLHAQRLAAAARGSSAAGTLFRRTRIENGQAVQRAEVRFDGVAGCLRTPGGGSSRQFLVQVKDGEVRTRGLTPREGARLMGLPDDYRLPTGETAALKVLGDGVVVPVVRWLADRVLAPLVCAPALAAAE